LTVETFTIINYVVGNVCAP